MTETEISQFHGLAEICRLSEKEVTMSANSIYCLDDEILELEARLVAKGPFYLTRPEGYPAEQGAEEGWYQLTKRGLVYLGMTANITLDDIDEASAIMLRRAEARIAELDEENKLLKKGLHEWNDAEDDAWDAVVAQLGIEQQENKRLQERIAELTQVLGMVEWGDWYGSHSCPWCDADYYVENGKHAPDCPRQKALGVSKESER